MGDEQEIIYRISGSADTGPIKQTAGELKEVGKSAASSGEAVKEQGASFVHAESAGRGFHHLMHGITSQSPLMGTALRLAISPVAGLCGLAVLAFKKMHDGLKELDDSIDTAKWESFKNTQQELAEAHAESARAAVLYEQKLRTMSDAAQNATEKMRQLLDIQQAFTSAEERLAEARRRVEMAAAKTIKDPAARAAVEASIENKYAEEGRARKDRDSALKVAMARKTIMVEAQAEYDQRVEVQKRRAALDAMGTKESIEQAAKEEDKRIAATKESIRKKTEEMGQLDTKPKTLAGALKDVALNLVIPGRGAATAIDQAKAKLEADLLTQQISGEQAAFEGEEKLRPRQEALRQARLTERAKAEQALQEAESQAMATAGRLKKAQEEAAKLAATEGIGKAERAAEAPLGRMERLIGVAKVAAEASGQDLDLMAPLGRRGGGVIPELTQAARQTGMATGQGADIAATIQQNAERQIDSFRGIGEVMKNFSKELDTLKQSIEQTKGQVRTRSLNAGG